MLWVNDTMDQPTFADLEYDGKKRKTRREIFLERSMRQYPSPRLREALNPGGVEVTRFGRTFRVVLCPVPFIS